jgi:pyruvate-formate lyase-activating enzyme
MALIDLYHAATADSLLKEKAIAAALVTQAAIRTEGGGVANHAARVAWADAFLADIKGVGEQVWVQLLQDATVLTAIINGADPNDTTIQSKVDAVIDALAV